MGAFIVNVDVVVVSDGHFVNENFIVLHLTTSFGFNVIRSFEVYIFTANRKQGNIKKVPILLMLVNDEENNFTANRKLSSIKYCSSFF